jgi:glutathione synthase/RimK-type ligase-like ATP-grasp enzyme
MCKYDITILTDHRYVNPKLVDKYVQNVLDEDMLIQKALEKEGLNVYRTNWDNTDFDWSSTEYVLFRTTWDYFDRFDEFSIWLEQVSKQAKLINSKEQIYWNIDKHYLQDLESRGVRIPNTLFIEKGETSSLSSIASRTDWQEFILKPVISGAARHTYRFKRGTCDKLESIFQELIMEESMMLQEFQENIIDKGEVSFMVFGGKYSHAILKKAKVGDFRVQDDFGGTIEHYIASKEEIEFIENCIQATDPIPVYARVDVMWNNQDELCLGELELIEPELWLRMNTESSSKFAKSIVSYASEVSSS